MTASLSLPRLRHDLAVSRQTTPQGPVFVIKDPVRRQFYRFREIEHFISGQLDGATSLEQVRARTEERFGASLEPEVLTGFVKRLDSAGLLAGSKRGERPDSRLSGSLLYLRFRAFDPDRLFNFLIGKIGFFFTPYFMAASALSICAAVCIAVSGWEEIVQSLPRLYQVSAVPLISVVIFLVIGAHEFAHGLTCKHFGGEVREIGFF